MSDERKQWFDKIVNQAVSLAYEAVQSPVGENVRQQVQHLVNETGPQLAEKARRYAAEISRPFCLGMGIEVTAFDDLCIEATLPHRWRNRDTDGSMHVSSLATVAEEISKHFWGKVAKKLGGQLKIKEIQGRFFTEAYHDVRALMSVDEKLKDAIVQSIKENGQGVVSEKVEILGKRDKKIAEVTVSWQIETPIRVKKAEVLN